MESNGILNIFINEEEPFMIWKYSNKIKYLNEEGEILDFKKKKFENLIVLEGELITKSLRKFNKILNSNIELKKVSQRFIFLKISDGKYFLRISHVSIFQ